MMLSSKWLAAMGALTVLGVCACGSTVDSSSTGNPTLLDCATVSQGQALHGQGSLDGQTATVWITQSVGGWKTIPTVTGVTGGTLESVELDDGDGTDVIMTITLSAGSNGGSFALTGALVEYETGHPECEVTRTFSFTVGGDGGTVSVM